MALPRLTPSQMQAAVDAMVTGEGTRVAGAKLLNLNLNTFKHHLNEARRNGIVPSAAALRKSPDSVPHLKAKLKALEDALRSAKKGALTHTMIKAEIIKLADRLVDPEMPAWLFKETKGHSSPGVPSLMVSDLHWGEYVDPLQINGVNKYDTAIARARMKRLAERTIRLLGIISPDFDYPGIVVPLGGDMISGNIHDELVATNELGSIPAVVDLFEAIGSLITTLLTKFDRVFLPCVTGNHGRDTRKIWSKDRHKTSFDWLLYCFLAKHFASDPRVTFFVPDGSDAYYKIYDHRYLLTHGDQFRGGDGVIGPLGPIIRGDHRKRSRNAQIDQDYDTMIMGHFHSHMQLTRLIVNGSLKGYDEYAYQGNFPYEPPQQALWLTHPRYRITYRMPVQVDAVPEAQKTNWVSVAK